MNNKLYTIDRSNIWGDYGSVLFSGLADRGEEDGILRLERTGPFVPPIFFPWAGITRCLVVSDDFRRRLEALSLPGVHFLPTIYDRIIRIDWHLWDLNSESPRKFPRGGEPGDYLTNRPTNKSIMNKMSKSWEVRLPSIPGDVTVVDGFNELGEPSMDHDSYEIELDRDIVPPIFSAGPRFGIHIINSDIKAWMETEVGQWIEAKPIKVIHKH